MRQLLEDLGSNIARQKMHAAVAEGELCACGMFASKATNVLRISWS